MYGWTKGWVCRVAEKAVIDLDLILGLTPKEVWMGTYSRPATKLRSFVG